MYFGSSFSKSNSGSTTSNDYLFSILQFFLLDNLNWIQGYSLFTISKSSLQLEINTQNAKKIDAYIRDFPQCKLDYPERVRIQDQITSIPVYRIPLDSLYYNVENGRFAAEYLAKQKELNRTLHPEDPEDAKEIEKMLREQSPSKTVWLKNNLKENKQENPGIITHDGYVINGNRRMSVLKLLQADDSEFGYIDVGRLPENIDESDLYKIELEKQMARDQKLDYGPINELLKIQHGLDSGLNEEQIAKTIGFSVEEIKEKVERLELIQEYLEFIDEPGNFKEAENINEHFIDLQNYIFSKAKQKKQQFSPLELHNIKQISFATIKGGIPHLELRKIPRMLNIPRIGTKFMEAKKFAKTDPSKTIEIFDVCATRLKAEDDRNRPSKILEAILGNFETLETIPDDELNKDEYKTLMKKIVSFLNEFKKFT